MPPSSDALLTSTSRPPSSRAASTSRRRTAASVTSPAIATTRAPLLDSLPRAAAERLGVPSADDEVVARCPPARGRSPAPSPRLAPVTIATGLSQSLHSSPPRSPYNSLELPYSIELQVHLKSSGNCAHWDRERGHDDWRGRPAQRRGDLCTAVLRGSGSDSLGTHRLRPPTLLRVRSSAASRSSSSRRRSGCRSTRFAPSSPSCRGIACPSARTGRSCREDGEADPGAHRRARAARGGPRPSASAAAACRSIDARSPTPAIARRAAAPARGTGWKDDITGVVAHPWDESSTPVVRGETRQKSDGQHDR